MKYLLCIATTSAIVSVVLTLHGCSGGSGGLEGLPTPSPAPPATSIDLPEMQVLPSGVQKFVSESHGERLTLHVLDDDLLHLYYGPEDRPLGDTLSMMSAHNDYQGAATVMADGQALRTASLSFSLDSELCVLVANLNDVLLSRTCATDVEDRAFALTIESPNTNQAYGLGEQFFDSGTDGQWLGRTRTPGAEPGNRMVGFSGGAVGNLQVPVLLTYQPEHSVGYFIDSPEAQTWDLTGATWTVTSNSSSPAIFVFTGDDLADIRDQYVGITGTPLVPPRAAFGLWVSEYGYDNWAEAESKINAQRSANMPLDGIVLDLQWFGGISNRQMGSLTWDDAAFPDPAQRLQDWKSDWGVSTVVIEESYIDTETDSYEQLQNLGYLVRKCEGCDSTSFSSWWGSGGMFDWTHKEGAAYWHETKRTPLIDAGVLGHWTDLGEPEDYDPDAWYSDTYTDQRHDHASVHNLYNFYWSQGIVDGYSAMQPDIRPWILSRSGTAGSQRLGVNLWSGDIGTNADSLAAHLQTQMHMSMSGFDYYGSDVGGFHRGSISDAQLNPLYTVWFANSALFDVPLRPHTENLCNCKQTAPSLVGDVDSNRFNLQLRYRLFPYYYSLAHMAYRDGSAMFPPLAYYHADDSDTIGNGSVKYIGPYLIARTHANTSDNATLPTYVPAGVWYDIHNHQWINSSGESITFTSENGGYTTLPLLAKAGAIVPMMYVDDQTANLAGLRRDSSVRGELIVTVVASLSRSDFTLYEDDGASTAYQEGAVAQTLITQEATLAGHQVQVAPTQGRYSGMATARSYHVELYLQDDVVVNVSLNGADLVIADSRAAYDALEQGAFQISDGRWIAKSTTMAIDDSKTFLFTGP